MGSGEGTISNKKDPRLDDISDSIPPDIISIVEETYNRLGTVNQVEPQPKDVINPANFNYPKPATKKGKDKGIEKILYDRIN